MSADPARHSNNDYTLHNRRYYSHILLGFCNCSCFRSARQTSPRPTPPASLRFHSFTRLSSPSAIFPRRCARRPHKTRGILTRDRMTVHDRTRTRLQRTGIPFPFPGVYFALMISFQFYVQSNPIRSEMFYTDYTDIQALCPHIMPCCMWPWWPP